jgi:outer membrane protein assembly factor BamB
MPLRYHRTISAVTAVIALFAACPGRPARAEDWPRFRGPRLDGISRETGLLKEWPPDGPRHLWKVDLSGGFSSVAVAGGRVFTQTREKDQEVVLCLDAATGKELWRYRYACEYGAYASFSGGGRPQSRTGPRATPVVDGDRVYTLGATGILLCLEAQTGKKVWQQDLCAIAGRSVPSHGFSGSPLVVGDRIYVNPGAPGGKSLAALEKKDGAVVWQALDDPIGYSTPLWVEAGANSQVIFFTGIGAVGVAPKDGRLLWRYPWKTQYDLNIATPIYADGKVFISSNYGAGGALFRLPIQGEAEGEGRPPGPLPPETIWKKLTMQNHFSTSVLYEGHLYGFSETRLRCVEFQTGEVKWDKIGLGRGSLVIADGHLIALGESGELILAAATPNEYREVSRCQIFAPETLTWTVPVLSGGRLFVRHENALVALDLRGKGP